MAALLLWGTGALGTPSPALLAAALFCVLVLVPTAALRSVRSGIQPGSLATWRRFAPALLLYSTSSLFTLHFLSGIFVPTADTVLHSTTRTPPSSTQKLRILSLNVWHGYPGMHDHERRYQHIRTTLDELDLDLIFVQEAWSTPAFGHFVERLGRDLDLWAAYARANGSLRFLGFEEGLGILSRHRLEEVEKMNLAPRWPPWEMRVALEAVTVLPEGDRLQLANTHLSGHSPSARVGQASALAAALIESNTSLVAGDLNAGARAPTLRTLEAVPMQPLISERIDHILASPALLEGWKIRSTRALHLGQGALEEKISDHPALLVEIKRRSAAEEVLEVGSGGI